MKVLNTPSHELRDVLTSLKLDGTPVYRSLGPKAYAAYRSTGFLIPRDGEAYVAGEGVFFFFEPYPICAWAQRPLVVVSSFEKLSKGRKTVDTRIRGFDSDAAAILDRERGPGNYTGYDLWLKVLEDDTITSTLTANSKYPDGLPVYTRRTPVRADELDFEIILTDVQLNAPEGVVYTRDADSSPVFATKTG